MPCKHLALGLFAAATLLLPLRPARATPRGDFVVVPPQWRARATPEAGDPVLQAEGDAIFYLNREGGSFAPGFNDSRTDRSSLLESPTQVPTWEISDAEWAEVLGCVEELFADYRVQVTDADPGGAPHVEAVIGGSYSDLRSDAPESGEVGGLAPFQADCGVVENAIVFVFPDDLDGDPRRVCEVAAQEIAHSLGLDHEYLCEDPMTYLTGCGDKAFRDAEAPCGELEPRTCAGTGYDCQRDTQNSVALLSERLGRRDGTGGPRKPVVGGCAASAGGPGGAGPWAAAMAAVAALAARRRRGAGGRAPRADGAAARASDRHRR